MNRFTFLLIIALVGILPEVGRTTDSLNVSIRHVSEQTGIWCGIVNDTLGLGQSNDHAFHVRLFDVSQAEDPRYRSSIRTVSDYCRPHIALLTGGRVAVNRAVLDISGDMSIDFFHLQWWVDFFRSSDEVVLQDSARQGWSQPHGEPWQSWTPGQITVWNGTRAYIPGFTFEGQSYNRTIRIVDSQREEWLHPESIWGVDAAAIGADNGLVAVSLWDGGLELYWDSDVRVPTLLYRHESYATATKFTFKDSLLFACYDDSVNIINVRIPSHPQYISTFVIPDSIRGVSLDAIVVGEFLILTRSKADEQSDGWLFVLNISNLRSPRMVGYYRGVEFSNLGINSSGSVLALARDGIYNLNLSPNLAVAESIITQPVSCTLSAYPNPFNARISFDFANLPTVGGFLRVYDQNGRVWSSAHIGSQTGRLAWDAADCPAGSYFIELQSSGRTVVKPVTLLK